jgi:ClpP class serine protease
VHSGVFSDAHPHQPSHHHHLIHPRQSASSFSPFSHKSFTTKDDQFIIRREEHSRHVLSTLRGGDGFIEINPEYTDLMDVVTKDGGDDDGSSTDEELSEEVDESDGKEPDLTTITSKYHKRRHSKSRKTTSKQTSPIKHTTERRRAASLNKLLKRHQLNFYILLTLFAFRKDIYQTVIKYNIIPTRVDGGGRRRITINWSTDGIKLLLVGEVVRRCFVGGGKQQQQQQHGDDEEEEDDESQSLERSGNSTHPMKRPRRHQSPPPVLPLILLLSIIMLPFLRNHLSSSGYTTPLLLPFLTSIILRFLRNNNNPGAPDSSIAGWIMSNLLHGKNEEMAIHQAYLPPLEQHYSFEQLNERYFRDWAAWRKGVAVNALVVPRSKEEGGDDDGVVVAGVGGGGVASLLSLLRPRSRPVSKHGTCSKDAASMRASLTEKYPNQYNNGTVIVMDMTKLDTQASRMESIRDQISFLIHLVQNEDDAYFGVGNDEEMKEDCKSEDRVVMRGGDENITATLKDILATVDKNAPIDDATTSLSTEELRDKPQYATPKVEVIVLLESPGGAVSNYGLASSHLQRLRSTPGVKLTICVDTVAASGGYMMACMSSPGQLYCAPFAMVGSIGVIGQSLNVQKTLEKYGVRPFVFRGGTMKNPVGMVGEVTKEGIGHMQDMVDRIHDAFREHVANARESALVERLEPLPRSSYFSMQDSHHDGSSVSAVMDVIDQVATGDVFLGMQALKLGLVDRLITSDEYIAERIQDGSRVLKLIVNQRPLGLSSFFMGHPPPRRAPGMSSGNGMLDILKKIVLRSTHSLMAWASDGLDGAMTFSYDGVNDVQLRSSLEPGEF